MGHRNINPEEVLIMVKLTKGQKTVLILTSVPMAATGLAGAVATFVNMRGVLGNGATALGIVAAGEGAVVVLAFVSLLLTLMGQHTPGVVRAGLWLLPLIAAGTGVFLAPSHNMLAVMAITPLAMTVAGEGIALVARRIVAFQTGVDIEQQRRSGLLLWHANRAANGRGLGKQLSTMAVWRLTKQFASTDAQMSVQLGEVQRYRVAEGADANLSAVLSGATTKTSKAPAQPAAVPAAPAAPQLPAAPAAAVTQPLSQISADSQPSPHRVSTETADDGFEWVKGLLEEAEANVATDPTLKLLTVAEVAALAGVTAGTVRSWVNRNKLSVADRDADGRSLFRQTDVSALLGS